MIVTPERKRAKTTRFFSSPALLAALWVSGCTTSALDLSEGLSPSVATVSAQDPSSVTRLDDSAPALEPKPSSQDIKVSAVDSLTSTPDAERKSDDSNQTLPTLQEEPAPTAVSSAQIASNTQLEHNTPLTKKTASQEKPTSLVAALFGSQPKSPAAFTAIKQSNEANSAEKPLEKDPSASAATQKAATSAETSIASLEQSSSASKSSKTDTNTAARLFSSGSGSNATVSSVSTSSRNPIKQQTLTRDYDYVLPGVRANGGLEIRHRSSVYDDSDIDADESDFGAPVTLASAGGMARNGLKTQHKSVQVACLKPKLVAILKGLERHYRRPVLITSGYRSPAHNKRVRGAKRSQHMACAAADIQVQGISKWEVARHLRSLPGRGGVGTYCHTESVHVDIGPERDWNWRCRR